MELLKKPEEENKIINFRRRLRKNPRPQPSPTNSVQDLARRLRNNVVEIEPSSLGKRKAAAEVEEHKTRSKVARDDRDLPPKLSDKFMKKVRELGFAGEPTLVIQKYLFQSDVSENHQRLAIPESQVPAQSRELFSKLGRELREGIKSTLIDDKLKEWEITFTKWGSNAQYVLRSPWKEVVKANGLKARVDKEIQVWSFMMNNKLYFILVQ